MQIPEKPLNEADRLERSMTWEYWIPFRKSDMTESFLRSSRYLGPRWCLRLHRHFRAERKPYRVVFVADPVCWTEAPEDLTTLCKQRNRWHRGLLDTLWIHRSMFMNPRYGLIGCIAFPYFVLFELFGPVIEMTGYVLKSAFINMNGWEIFVFSSLRASS